MMIQPDWSYAPSWARFLAQDQDGCFHWFEAEPSIGADGYWNGKQGRRFKIAFYTGMEGAPITGGCWSYGKNNDAPQ